MTASELQAALRELLADDLGAFVSSTGARTPAIRVIPPEVPAEWRATGLQCLIARMPELKRHTPTTGSQVFIDREWLVTLVQFDRSKSLVDAYEKVLRRFLVRGSVYQQISTQTYEQATIRIYDPASYNAIG